MTDNRLNFPMIDVLRGVAALLVLVYHVIMLGQWNTFPVDWGLVSFRFGWVGVNLFFVISGFVIGLTALSGFERSGHSFRRGFVRRRLARIVPLYLLTGMVYLVMIDSALLQGTWTWLATQVGSHLFFIHNLSPKTHGTINGANWSVALEMQFYLCMIVLTPWLVRVSTLRLLLGGLVLAAAYRWLTTLALVPGAAKPITQWVVSVWLPGVTDHFAVGIVLAKVVRSEAWRRMSKLPSQNWLRFVLAMFAAVGLLRVAGEVLLTGVYWENVWVITFFPTLLLCGLGCVVLAALNFPYPDSLAIRPFRYLGEISYGIYLWHFPILISALHRKLPWQGIDLLGFVMLATLVLSIFTWHFVEQPALKWGRAAQPMP